MINFSDLIANGTVKNDTQYIPAKRVSIEDVVNKQIIVLGVVKNIKTKQGEGRYLVHFKTNDSEGKFFTNATIIKHQLDQVPTDSFPFTTIVEGIRDGNRKIYRLS